MKVPQFLQEYVFQVDSYESFVENYQSGADEAYMYSLVYHYFSDKANTAINEIQDFLKKEGVNFEIIDQVELEFHEVSVTALQD